MSKRTISINPQFFNISKKKKKIIPSEVNINASNIRQLLLDKLKEHKKTRKIETNPKPVPLLQDKTFDEISNEKEPITKIDTESKSHSHAEVISDVSLEPKQSQLQIPIQDPFPNPNLSDHVKDKPYGNLKNGSKPTYKMYQSQGPQPESQSEFQTQEPQDEPIVLEEKEVKKTFKLGKSGKRVSILIKNNKSRKKVEDSKTERGKTHVSTIKNYLKKHNLIKYGSTAPTKLLREMYETSELCGGISNENKDVLIHNFHK
jgi:hypothetical protein